MRFCAFLDGTKDFPFLVLILVLSTCMKCFYREPGHPLLLDVTSWMVVVNSMDKINSFYTILLLFFIFSSFFHPKAWQVNHFGDLSVSLIHFCIRRWTYFAIYVSKPFPYIHQSLTNDSSQSFLFVKILGLYYVFHHEMQWFSFVINSFTVISISLFYGNCFSI